jgi:hypothetical protein
MIELTALTETGLNANTAVELRKAAAELGIKGASKGKKADLILAIMDLAYAAQDEQAKAAELEAEAAQEALVEAATKRGNCTECGRKEDFRASGLCEPCREYAEWENAHSDEGHDDKEFPVRDALTEACQVCHPELDGRTVRPTSKSRAGMVIVAKGSEIHKSLIFKEAAEKIGWTVEIERETYELPEGSTGEGTRFYATGTKGNDSISLAWDGRAYDYPASSAKLNGKVRKVRNLKEALRLL